MKPPPRARRPRSAPSPVRAVGELPIRTVNLRGATYLLRPLRPADVRRLQDFFYSHTADTIQMRYGHVLTRMTRSRAFDLVNIDQTRDLALALVEVQGPRQIIHAVGRYFLDTDGSAAEVAFVVRESKRRSGLATTLMDAICAVARQRGLTRL